MSTVFRRKKPHGYHLPLPETGVQSSELELTIAVATVAAAPIMAVSTPALMKITSLTWNKRKSPADRTAERGIVALRTGIHELIHGITTFHYIYPRN